MGLLKVTIDYSSSVGKSHLKVFRGCLVQRSLPKTFLKVRLERQKYRLVELQFAYGLNCPCLAGMGVSHSKNRNSQAEWMFSSRKTAIQSDCVFSP